VDQDHVGAAAGGSVDGATPVQARFVDLEGGGGVDGETLTRRPGGANRSTLVGMKPLVAAGASLLEVVEAVRGLEYGRPSERTVAGMLRERRGTCSAKHAFLAEALERDFPGTRPQIVHRVYRLDRAGAREMFGPEAAGLVPEGGLVDVHRYLTAEVEGRRITIDVTFPGPPWDGRSPLPIASGPGEDFPAGPDPDAEKRRLEAEHCDPALREPFIEALGRRGVAQG
jgi:hypothetical protein